MPKAPSWLPRVLAESVLIVFSILLAFAVESWRQDRADARLAAEARESFVREIRQNREQLAERLPYHERVRDLFARAHEQGSVRTLRDLTSLEGFQGLRPPFLTATAWQSAMATGALARMDYPSVNALSHTYTFQSRVAGHADGLRDLATTLGDEDRLQSTLFVTVLLLSDLVIAERELVRAYDETLAVLEGSGAG